MISPYITKHKQLLLGNLVFITALQDCLVCTYQVVSCGGAYIIPE